MPLCRLATECHCHIATSRRAQTDHHDHWDTTRPALVAYGTSTTGLMGTSSTVSSSLYQTTFVYGQCTNSILSTVNQSIKSINRCKTDWVKVLRPARHTMGHFGDVLSSQSLGLVLKIAVRRDWMMGYSPYVVSPARRPTGEA